MNALRGVANDFGEPARSTILYENGLKHAFEIDLIRKHVAPGDAIVDVGGGLGVNLICLRRQGHTGRLVLVDRFSEYDDANRMGSHANARRLLTEAGIEIVESDFWPMLELPLDDAGFSLACSFDVVEHLPGNPIQHLTEIRRTLKPQGIMILGAPNAASLMKRVHLGLRGQHPYADFGDWMRAPYYEHYREYTPREYGKILEATGFRVIQQVLSSAVPRSRARNSYYRRKRSRFSAVAAALFGIAALEAVFPGMRHTVYTIGKKPPV